MLRTAALPSSACPTPLNPHPCCFPCCSLLPLQVLLEVWGEADSLEALHAAVAQFCPDTKARWRGPEQVWRGGRGRQSALQLLAAGAAACMLRPRAQKCSARVATL